MAPVAAAWELALLMGAPTSPRLARSDDAPRPLAAMTRRGRAGALRLHSAPQLQVLMHLHICVEVDPEECFLQDDCCSCV